jgi:hypothetical protein
MFLNLFLILVYLSNNFLIFGGKQLSFLFSLSSSAPVNYRPRFISIINNSSEVFEFIRPLHDHVS